MSKRDDHKRWSERKTLLDQQRNVPSFKERDVRWCRIGVNVGYEILGKGDDFTRPVLVLKKFSRFTFLGAPLSTKPPKFETHIPVRIGGRDGIIRLDQIRTMDARRFRGDLIQRLPVRKFSEIKRALVTLLA